MRIYIGADHRGFILKEILVEWLKQEEYEVVDVGAYEFNEEDDYPDYAEKVAKEIAGTKGERGILICGSGHGVDIAANRFKEIRSILGYNLEVVRQGREHEDANILSLPADWVDEKEAKERVRIFLETEFSGEVRHRRRIEKLGRIGD